MNGLAHWRYKNSTLLVASIVTIFFLADTDIAHALISRVGTYGYLGAAITGVFFVSTFTVAPASLVLFHLAQEFNPVLIAASAGLGALLGDLLIFRFLRDGVFEELRPLVSGFGESHLGTLFRTPYFAWLMPVIGAAIIASPLPDEIGIGLLGLSRMKLWQFALLAFALNALGIFAIVTVAAAL